MKLSVIVPAYNAERTLERCLRSIFNSKFKNFEVIVVDDNSRDRTHEIAKSFGAEIIKGEVNIGEARARNRGAESANGEILVFIDADVVIKNDTLEIVNNTFEKNQTVSALTGILSKEHLNNDFFSQYKNLYMHYIFNQISGDINFLYGSIHAIKKNIFEPYDKNMVFGADTELGYRLASKGRRILLVKELEVVHLKKYTMPSFLRNDFNIPFYWTQIFMKYKFYKSLIKSNRFAHSNIAQILSILMVMLSMLLLPAFLLYPINIYIILILFSLFITLNSRFFILLKRERGALFSLKSVLVTYLDMIVMGAGIFCGTIYYILKTKRLLKIRLS